MTGRDRIVLIVIAVAVLLVGVWIEVVSPERKKASATASQVAAAQAQLTAAQGQLAHGQTAQSQYASAYATTVKLGKAVPASAEVPSLIDQLAQAAGEKSVDFESISGGGSSTSSSSSTSPSGTLSSAQPSTASAGTFAALPFSFSFEGSYFDLEHLFRQLADFVTVGPSGSIEVSGRLLTIQSVDLTPGSASQGGASKLTGAITATAYVLPAAQSSSAPATPGAPSAATGAPAAASAAASSPTAPAVVRVNP